MRTSRRAARDTIESAPRRRGIFRSPDGGLRGGWLLAVSLLCYVFVALGLRLALAAGFGRLFLAWGVDASTASLAPAWARWVYRWHGTVASALTALALVALSLGLRRLWQGPSSKRKEALSEYPKGSDSRRRDAINGVRGRQLCRPYGSNHGQDGLGLSGSSLCAARSPKAFPLRGRCRGAAVTDEVSQASPASRACFHFALLGLALALFPLLLGLIPDSIRPEWPLTAPRFTLALIPLCAVLLLSTLAEELFTKAVLYDGAKARWGIGWAVAIAYAAFFLVQSGWAASAVGAVNGLLMALLACAAYERFGLWASVGLRFGQSVATVFLFGFGGKEASVYRFYGVSEVLLTGGDAGPVYGLWTTLLLAGALLALGWRQLKKLMGKTKRKP